MYLYYFCNKEYTTMPFIKGEKNPNAGRKTGSTNFNTREAKENLTSSLDFAKFKRELEKLEGKEFCDLFLKAVAYILPKPAPIAETDEATSTQTEFQRSLAKLLEANAESAMRSADKNKKTPPAGSAFFN